MNKLITSATIAVVALASVGIAPAQAAPTLAVPAQISVSQVVPMGKQPIIHRKDKWKCGWPWIYRDYAKKYCGL